MSAEQLEIISSNIADNRCVLFLGPRFAIDKDGSKVHTKLSEYISSVSNKNPQLPGSYKLDESFDNLFIIKDSKPSAQKIMSLRMLINNFYNDIVPHEVYQKIASLRFSAVFSCTHDHFLPNAFSDKWERPAFFKYFSRKQVANDIKQNDLPLYYNAFGSVKDKQSLISTYDSFYDFLIKLISNEPKLPQELQTCLNQASVMILLGFDLTKWYMPLLFRKLKEYIGPKEEDAKIIAYVSTEDSSNPLDVSDYYFSHFAVEVNILDTDVVTFFDELCKKDEALLRLQKLGSYFKFKDLKEASAQNSQLICTQLKEAYDLIGSGEILGAIELLETSFQNIGDDYARMVKFKGTYNRIQNEYTDILNADRRDMKLAELQSAFTNYCNEKRGEISCQ